MHKLTSLQPVLSGHQENTFQYQLKKECAWPLFPEWLVGSWKVQLIIESVDNILRCNHSNQWNLFRQYFQILTLGIFQSKKVSTVELLSYDHLFYTTTLLLRPYIFHTQAQKSLSYFIILNTTLMQPPRYKEPGFYSPTVVALMGFYCTSPVHLSEKYWTEGSWFTHICTTRDASIINPDFYN